ncbi:hypothetical protein [Actinomyces glycerinitolerans]|uniref:Uncharacterized protein n=1 Tax=Actinomyces glycerinitolerans TaxID=1892869 RepID=A0A1M4RZE2_9ACTO|nr:hypothetical protein [Actinomyces glycerinitolerans]SHE25336.1 Hypothetical protein ACGLYG10_1552 [Actinomyces glycerinitolerans]
MFDLIGDDGVRRPFTGDIRDLRPGVVQHRLRIDQEEATRLGLGQIPDDLEDQYWDRRWYPTCPEDGTIDYDCLTKDEFFERDAENLRRNRLRHAQLHYTVTEDTRGRTRVRQVPPKRPRWADDPTGLKMLPPTCSFRLRRGFLTSIRLDANQPEPDVNQWYDRLNRQEQDAWIVGLFRTDAPEGQTTLVLEYYGQAWAAARTDGIPWPTDLNASELSIPTLWLPVTLTPLPTITNDPGSPVSIPTSAEPVAAQVATDHALFGPWWSDGDPVLPYRPQPWIKPAPNREHYRQALGHKAKLSYRKAQEQREQEMHRNQEDTSQ